MVYYYAYVNSYGRYIKKTKSSKRVGDKQVNSFVKFSVIEEHFNTYQARDGESTLQADICFAI